MKYVCWKAKAEAEMGLVKDMLKNYELQTDKPSQIQAKMLVGQNLDLDFMVYTI